MGFATNSMHFAMTASKEKAVPTSSSFTSFDTIEFEIFSIGQLRAYRKPLRRR